MFFALTASVLGVGFALDALDVGDKVASIVSCLVGVITACGTDRQVARRHWRQAQSLYQRLGHKLADLFDEWLRTVDALEDDALREADRVRRQNVRKLY